MKISEDHTTFTFTGLSGEHVKRTLQSSDPMQIAQWIDKYAHMTDFELIEVARPLAVALDEAIHCKERAKALRRRADEAFDRFMDGEYGAIAQLFGELQ